MFEYMLSFFNSPYAQYTLLSPIGVDKRVGKLRGNNFVERVTKMGPHLNVAKTILWLWGGPYGFKNYPMYTEHLHFSYIVGVLVAMPF
jgi:hypothetical protein